MEPWAKRIQELLEEGRSRGLDMPGLVAACKAKQPSVWEWFNPKNGKTTKNITALNAVRAARYLNTTAEYIILGHGPRHPSQSVELDLSMLESSIVSVKKALQVSGLELDAFISAPMVAFAYRERTKLARELSKEAYAEFDAVILQRLRGELGNERETRPTAGSSKGGDEEIAADQSKARRRRK